MGRLDQENLVMAVEWCSEIQCEYCDEGRGQKVRRFRGRVIQMDAASFT